MNGFKPSTSVSRPASPAFEAPHRKWLLITHYSVRAHTGVEHRKCLLMSSPDFPASSAQTHQTQTGESSWTECFFDIHIDPSNMLIINIVPPHMPPFQIRFIGYPSHTIPYLVICLGMRLTRGGALRALETCGASTRRNTDTTHRVSVPCMAPKSRRWYN